jgi:aminoglycoside phosphotransferase (APT) family kinase protein
MTPDLDIEQPGVLVDWLRAHHLISGADQPVCTVLPGGVSNRTVLVDRSPDDSWVVKQALAKLRVKVDWFSSPERIHREADGLRWLVEFAPAGTITPLVFEDHEDHIIGMMAVPNPHVNWKAMLLRGDVRPDHVAQFARIGASIHARSAQRIEELRATFGDRGFFQSLRVEPYYSYTAGQVAEAQPFYETLIAEMASRQETLVHGDFSPKNVLVHAGRLVLLDHEVCHLGDPGFDLGFGMTHLLSKAHHLPKHRASFLAATGRFWNTYRETVTEIGGGAWLNDLEPRAVRHTLGCLLARVRGRSPLEYLDETSRTRQAAAVATLMTDPPTMIDELARRFGEAIAREEARA